MARRLDATEMLLCVYVVLAVLTRQMVGLPNIVRIGGLFEDDEDPTTENAFRYGIHSVNADHNMLKETRLAYDIQHLPARNSFIGSKKACNQAGLGVAAVFGPSSADLASHVNSMCSSLEVPHVEVRLVPQRDEQQLFSVNVYPDASYLVAAYLDVLRYYNWRKFCVVYGDEADLLLLQAIIRAPLGNGVHVIVRQVRRDNMRETLKEIEKRGVRRIVAHLNIEKTQMFLKAALQLGMIDPSHHYLFTNLDLDVTDLEDYRFNHVNLTGFRLVRYHNPKVKAILAQMHANEKRTGSKLLNSSSVIKIEAALMYDAVHVLAHALQQVDHSTRLRLVNLSCDGNQAWAFGSSLYNYLNLVDIPGLTGRISFDRGRRVNFNLTILQLRPEGLVEVGHWTRGKGINLTSSFETEHTVGMYSNKSLVVTSILEPPYVMLKRSEAPLTGNDRYEGFCVDILKEIAQIVGFKYSLKLVADGKYGAPDDDGNWNGMVRELVEGNADLAVASLTINYIREQVIDFTKPFMNLGISILFKRPRRESPGLFSFLNPLAVEIWLYVIAAYFLVSLILFVLARFSPYEWYNPHPCNTENDTVENMFTMSNSFWFAVGTLMQQGSDINPHAVSTRIVGGIWWFFTLIIISSYTANLAAFLTVERMVSPIENAEDLSKQTKISYGTIAGGSTMTFFRESKIPVYQRMWAFMESHERPVFVKKSQEGIDRVLNDNYAFLMESTMIDYNIQRNCELMQVGGLLDSKGYGIGTPIGSAFRDPISMAILELQENGRIQLLYNKWWRNAGTCNQDDKKKDSKANSLGIANVGGIFVVLFVGLALAIVTAVVEFVWNSRRNAAVDKQSIWTEMVEEMRFAVRCGGSAKKPVLRHPNSRRLRPATDPCTIDSPNGMIHLRDMQHSPRAATDPRFRYHVDVPDNYRGEYSYCETSQT